MKLRSEWLSGVLGIAAGLQLVDALVVVVEGDMRLGGAYLVASFVLGGLSMLTRKNP